MSELKEDFLVEMFKSMLSSYDTFLFLSPHIKYSYLPSVPYKEILKYMNNYSDLNGSMPSIGTLVQDLSKRKEKDNKEIISVLASIKKVAVPNKDNLLRTFDDFLKKASFLETYPSIADLYNEGDTDGAWKKIEELYESVNKSVIATKSYERIFGGFENRVRQREFNFDEFSRILMTLGIDPLDDVTKVYITDTILICAQSGVGKTFFFVWAGVHLARLGYNVLHVTAEGSQEEVEDRYDSCWTSRSIKDIERGGIDKKTFDRLNRTSRDIINNGGEVIVKSYEQFDSASMKDIRELITDVERQIGKVHVVIMDYLDLFEPGNGKKYSTTNDGERARRRAASRIFKNLAMEKKFLGITGTQASTVDPDKLNNPDFVMTRYNVSEFKSIIDPFSLFITFNQTATEYKSQTMRLHIDKQRKKRAGQTIRIVNAFDHSRFYNKKETFEKFY